MEKRRIFSTCIAAIAFAFVLTGCNGGTSTATTGGTGGDAEPIKVGLLASLNGENQPWGQDSQDGARLAEEEINNAGGINGRKIKILIEDTGSKPEGGKSATEKLVGQDKVVCVLGEVASGITLPAAQVCQEQGVPIIAIGATRVDVTQQGGSSFRVCYTDDFQGAAMAKFAYDDLKMRNMAIMTDRKLPYSTGLTDVFRAAFEKLGGKIVTEEKYESGNLDFKAQLANIKAKNPDGMFCSGYFTEVGPIARQRMDVGMGNVKMLGGDGWDSKDLLTSGGKGIIGNYFSNHYSELESRTEVKDFVTKFKKKFGHDAGTAMAALTYDAVMVFAEAAKNGNPKNSIELINAIGQVKDLKGVTGTITIGPDGNAQKPTLVLEVTEKGYVPKTQIPFFVFDTNAKITGRDMPSGQGNPL